MRFLKSFSQDAIFFTTIGLMTAMGIACAAFVKWQVLIGISIVAGLVFFVSMLMVVLDSDRVGPVTTGVMVGALFWLVLSWATFFIAWGLRS